MLFLAFLWIPYEYFLVCDTLLELSSLSLESVPSFFPHIIVTQTAAGVYICTRLPEALAGARRLRNRGGIVGTIRVVCSDFDFLSLEGIPLLPSLTQFTPLFILGVVLFMFCVYLPYLSIWRVSQQCSDWTFNGSTSPPVTQLRSRGLQLF